jgi:multiple sugar transport system permease protein
VSDTVREPAVPVASAPPAALEAAQRPPSNRRFEVQHPVQKAVFLVLLVGASVAFIYPFLWTVSASLKPRAYVFDNQLIPTHFHPSNYADVWNAAPMLHWLFNSVWIGVAAALTVTFSSALVAFSFAYFRFPGRNFLFACVLATMMMPFAATMIPVYLIWNHLHLTGTQYPLWVGNLFGSAFYIFLQRQFFLGIPRDVFEAARIDGDGYFSMFRRIALPLAKPALIVTFVFEFQSSWTDLIKPLIYLRSDDQYTVPRGLKSILDTFGQGGGGQADWQIVIAATVLATLPMILVFFLGQRYFVEGIATQGRKG